MRTPPSTTRWCSPILDGLVVQYAGGPFPDGNFAIDYFSIFASRDPVAIDATAVRLIEEIRLEHKMPSIRTMSAYVEAAEIARPWHFCGTSHSDDSRGSRRHSMIDAEKGETR